MQSLNLTKRIVGLFFNRDTIGDAVHGVTLVDGDSLCADFGFFMWSWVKNYSDLVGIIDRFESDPEHHLELAKLDIIYYAGNSRETLFRIKKDSPWDF
jgi:hypothetical protein